MANRAVLKNYLFPIILMVSVILGGLYGYSNHSSVAHIKPLGQLFLNLILTAIVPLIFFSIASALAKIESWKNLSKLLGLMFLVFTSLGILASILSLCVVKLFPVENGLNLISSTIKSTQDLKVKYSIVEMFSVSDFSQLFSHQHMLALILFSMFVGMASGTEKTEHALFVRFLNSGEVIFTKVFTYIMYLAPIGFFAYFANMVADLGPNMISNYFNVTILYYGFALFHFFIISTLVIYFFGAKDSFKKFWSNISIPIITAMATCSSAATIPAALKACKNMGMQSSVYETVIPIGTLIHKQGSIVGGIFKIAFLFAMFHLDLSGLIVLSFAVVISLLVGTVMGAIPSGGMLGELLILSVYGFPNSALIAVAAISIIIDPMATMLNVNGNILSSLLISKRIKK